MNHREQGGESKCLVQWKGYDESHNEWKNAVLVMEQHHLDLEEETDEKFFRRVRRERESTSLTRGIRLKIPRNGYVDTGSAVPADVKKAEKQMREMQGHLGL